MEYMFHGGCRSVARVLSLALEPIGESTVHELAGKVSCMVRAAPEPSHRRCIAVDGAKLRVEGDGYTYGLL